MKLFYNLTPGKNLHFTQLHATSNAPEAL